MTFFVRCKQTGLSATGVCFLLFFPPPSSALLLSSLPPSLHRSPHSHCRRALICLEVLSSFRCRVVYLEKKEEKKTCWNQKALTSPRASWFWTSRTFIHTSVRSEVPPHCWTVALSAPWCSPSSARHKDNTDVREKVSSLRSTSCPAVARAAAKHTHTHTRLHPYLHNEEMLTQKHTFQKMSYHIYKCNIEYVSYIIKRDLTRLN